MDEHKYRLGDLSGEASRFTYEYDFGDAWLHDILVENVLVSQTGVRYPCCLAGARACPPEDVGGMTGYENFLAAINNPATRTIKNTWNGSAASSIPRRSTLMRSTANYSR